MYNSKVILNLFKWHSYLILLFILMSCQDNSKALKPYDDEFIDFSFDAELTGTAGPVYSLDWFPGGNQLISTGYGELNLWDMDSLNFRQKFTEHSSFVWGVAVSPDTNQMYVASASEDSTVKIWNFQALQTLSLNSGWAFCVSFSPDGTKYVYGNSAGKIEMRKSCDSTLLNSYQLQRQGTFPEKAIICIDWSPDNQKIAAGCWYGGIFIFDADTLNLINILDANVSVRDDVNGLDWSPDSEVLATAHQDGIIRFWDVNNGTLTKSIIAHSGWVRGISWSPDGGKIASGGEDGKVYIWKYSTSKKIGELSNSSRPIWAVQWSPDGNRLAAGTGIYDSQFSNGSIFIWHLNK